MATGEVFHGPLFQLKTYLKHLLRSHGIRVKKLEEVKPGIYWLVSKEGEGMEIKKNATEMIRIERREYQGHEFIDVRVYFDAGNGEWKPCKKGITFSPKIGDQIIKGIEEVLKQ